MRDIYQRGNDLLYSDIFPSNAFPSVSLSKIKPKVYIYCIYLIYTMIPSNFLFVFPHTWYQIPAEVDDNTHDAMHTHSDRLLKNFSDWATRFLIDDSLAGANLVTAEFPRAVGDPNRARNAPDIFRETDFWGNPVWKTPLTTETKEALLSKYYDGFHAEVRQKIMALRQRYETIFLIEIHDTGDILMAPTPENDSEKWYHFPEIALCNSLWKTASDETMHLFGDILGKNFGFPVSYNDPYNDNHITEEYSREWSVVGIQVELWRYLLLDEKSQVIRNDIAETRAIWMLSMQEFADQVDSIMTRSNT